MGNDSFEPSPSKPRLVHAARGLNAFRERYERRWDLVEAILIAVSLGLSFYGFEDAKRIWEFVSQDIVVVVLATKFLSLAAWRVTRRLDNSSGL